MDAATPVEPVPLMVDWAMDTWSESTKYKLAEIETEITTRLVNVQRDIFEIGKLLARAKPIVGHGMFMPWIDKCFGRDLPYTTAYAYMTIYETFQDAPKEVQLLPLTLLIVMTCDTFPEPIRDIIIKNAARLSTPDIDNIKNAYSQFKKERLTVDRFAAIARKQIAIAFKRGKSCAQRRGRSDLYSLLGYYIQDIIKAIRKATELAPHLDDIVPPIENAEEGKQILQSVDQMIFDLQQLKATLEGRKELFESITKRNPSHGKQMVKSLIIRDLKRNTAPGRPQGKEVA
jgi:hypothetical protein